MTDAELQHQPKVQGGDPYLSTSCNQILLKAEDIAKELGDEFVAVEPLLLALLAVQSSASRILKDAGITEKDLKSGYLRAKKRRKGAKSKRRRKLPSTKQIC